MFGRLGSGIFGAIGVVTTYRYIKDNKNEKKNMEKELKAQRLENEYLRKKIDKMEDAVVIDDNERREENIDFMNDFDTLIRVMKDKSDIREKELKKIDKKINRAIEKNRKAIERIVNDIDLD